MAFVLEKVSAEDQLRMLNDAKNCDETKYIHFNYAYTKRPERFTENWAIDHERDYYLIKAPVFTGSGVKGFLYYFYYKGKLYEIQTKGVFGNNMPIRLTPLPSPELLTDAQNVIREAFNIYGYFGTGDTLNDSLNNAQFVESFEEYK